MQRLLAAACLVYSRAFSYSDKLISSLYICFALFVCAICSVVVSPLLRCYFSRMPSFFAFRILCFALSLLMSFGRFLFLHFSPYLLLPFFISICCSSSLPPCLALPVSLFHDFTLSVFVLLDRSLLFAFSQSPLLLLSML